MTLDQIKSEALKLDLRSRAELAHELLQSLEQLSEEERSQLWAEEAERRQRGMEANPSSGLDATNVIQEMRSKLGR